MATSNSAIKITELPNIGNNIAATTLIPVVNMAGVPITQKANLQITGNLILAGAGGANFVPAGLANIAYSVANSYQPNITRVGNLNINTFRVNGGVNGQFLQTNGSGTLTWAVPASGNVTNYPGGANSQIQFNNSGSFGASTGLTWDASNNKLNTVNFAASQATIYGNVDTVNLNATANIKPNAIYTDNYFYANGYVFGGGGGNGVPGGANTQIQFNDGGVFGGNTGFTFNKTTGAFTSPFLAGNGNGLSNIQGANVSGAVGLATYAGTANAVAGANVTGAVSFADTANSVAAANVVGLGNIATVALNGNGSQFLRGNGTWGNATGGSANTGNVTFDNINIIGTGNLNLQPDPANTGSYLDIFLTSGPDLHLVASASANLILGKDNQANVMTSWDGNAYIQSWNLNTGLQGGVWTFGGDGNLTAPGNIIIDNGVDGNITSTGNVNVISNNNQWVFGANGNLTVPNDILAQESNDLNITVYNVDNTGGATISLRNFDNNAGSKTTQFDVGPNSVSIITDFANAGYTWTFDNAGNITFPTSAIIANISSFGPGLSTGMFDANGMTLGTGAGNDITFTPTDGAALYSNGYMWTFGTDGNLNVPGNIVGPASANFVIYANAGVHEFTFGDDGTFYAPDNVVLGGTSISIGPGANTLTGISNAVFIASSNSTAYIQAAITNVSDVGSADWAAYGHHGDDNGGWIDVGFNSSGYGGTDYTITGPGDGSLLVESYYDGQAPGGRGGNLIIATGSQGTVNDIIFGTGGFLIANEFMRISNSNNSLEINRTGASLKFPDGSEQTTAYLGGNSSQISNGNSNVTITTGNGNVYINANSGTQKQWSFDTTGLLRTPGDISIYGGTTIDFHQQVGNITWGTSYMAFSQYGRVELNTNLFANANTIGAQYLKGDGSNISNISGSNIVGNVGNALNAYAVAAANVTGLGNLALLNKDGNSSNVLYGNGVFASVPATYGNSNVATFLASFGSNTISTTGNINGGNITVTGTANTGISSIVAGVTNTLLPNTIASFSSNVNSYTQVTLQNKSNGADATADYIITADNGSDTVNYADFGIINSGYDNGTPTNSLGNIVYAADTYLYAQGNTGNASQSGGNLAIGTTVPGKNVKIFAGGVNNSSIIANIANTGMTVTGNITVANGSFVGNGAGLTNVTVNAAGNIQGTSSNVSLVAGSYTYTFDNTGVATMPGTVSATGNINGTAFAVGNGAVSNCALAMTPTAGIPGNYAIRDYSTANSVMFFDTTIGSANTGGSFQFRGSSAYTTYASINQYGVIQPTKPGFRVYGAGTTTNLTTTVNTNGILNGNNYAVDYNQGSYLNTTTGIFTAPVAGLYSVHLVARVSNTSSAQIAILKNYASSNTVQAMWECGANCTANHFGVSSIVKLAVGDTLVIKVLLGQINFDSNDNWAIAFLG